MMRKHTAIIVILFLAALLRFNNLMWGSGNYFHPDENNMARSITQMKFENSLHPDFFAYGQLPLYMSFFSGVLSNSVAHVGSLIVTPGENDPLTVSLPQAIFWLRFWSAAMSVISVYFVFGIAKTLVSKLYALLAALLTACTPGLIQAAHFGTTESLLTYFFLLILFFCIRIIQSKSDSVSSNRLVLLLGIAFGLSVGVKLTAVYFFVPIGMTLLIHFIRIRAQKRPIALVHRLLLTLLLTVSISIGYIISSPHNLISYKQFEDSMRYELDVAQGLDVFYTRQFEDTVPILFQITHILPYALGWVLFVIGSISLLYALFKIIWHLFHFHTANRTPILILVILLISFFSFFIPNSILYVKWTRFLTPVFPLFSIFTVLMVSSLMKSVKQHIDHNYKTFRYLFLLTFSGIIVICLIPGIWYSRMYAQEDTRVQVSSWIYENIPPGSYILSETANVVDIPVSITGRDADEVLSSESYGYKVISFNFYELDREPILKYDLIDHLEKADYIFVPSRRIFMNHQKFPEKYPLLDTYYEALFDGSLGFELVHVEQPVLIDERAEETWTVFDHPTIRIYNKTTPKTRNEYGTILESNI
ncbi:MAG: glycosyltransferase family 39 protein [Candidatus Roizmanbacteria bacterium]|nr:glycosyltransferase family 39 protein [Candidatus Roizmanbacteria bacterium]